MKKKQFLYDGYDEYLYTGLQGYVMRKNHKYLSRNIPEKLNRRILDIGGGAKPHCSLIDLKGVNEYWVSDTRSVFEKNTSLSDYKIKKHFFEDDCDYNYFVKSKTTFSRIIASHVWEHVDDPESHLLKWINLLDNDGCLDIAIPCDPGWAWRLGQLVGRKKAVKLYNMSSKDIDLMMTREHINSCQNLKRIIYSYTNKSGRYYPSFIPIIDINLFIFFRLTKSDFNF
jgi:phosphatidylethanolamine/phosphatidyl-N-methylethanolamine N-methyltransferase